MRTIEAGLKEGRPLAEIIALLHGIINDLEGVFTELADLSKAKQAGAGRRPDELRAGHVRYEFLYRLLPSRSKMVPVYA